jgi:hypothetical protein
MKSLEEKLRMQQDQARANEARKALDQGDAVKAVSLVGQISNFLPQNLITLMSVIGFHSEQKRLAARATELFHQTLTLCPGVNSLTSSALWVRNPNRVHVLPDRLRQSIDHRRRQFDPGWNGIWQNDGIGPANQTLALKSKRPDEIHDVEMCLTMATQAGNWGPWLKRYHALGGSSDDPRFLKFWVSLIVKGNRDPSFHDKMRLKKFTKYGNVMEVRSFLRKITPTKRSLKGKNPNLKMAHYALFLYCESEHLEHTAEDWMHIAKSALHLEQRIVARMVQRILAEMGPPPVAQEVFDELVQVYGPLPMTESLRDDIGFEHDPIWRGVYPQLPRQGTPQSILYAYSRGEIESE